MTSESATPTPPASSAVVERLTWFADEYAHDESYLTDDNGEQHELREMLRDALSLSQSLARELGEAEALLAKRDDAYMASLAREQAQASDAEARAETAERQLGEVKERLTDERDALEGTQAQLRDANEAVTALERQLGEAREALRPFAEWAANNVACAGEDASFIWEGLGCQRERISVWFGPSEFGRALFSSQALAPLRGGGGEGSSVVYVRGRGPTRPEGEAVPSTREGQRVSARVSIEESAIGEKRWAVIITRPDHIIWRTLWERYATQAEAQKGAEAAHAYLEAGRE